MPGDTLLYLAVADHDLHQLERTGVAPDYRVEQPMPYAHGEDPVLEAAARLLSASGAK
jgi:carboxyl-terminal processing protease